jgi:hypothetical protein
MGDELTGCMKTARPSISILIFVLPVSVSGNALQGQPDPARQCKLAAGFASKSIGHGRRRKYQGRVSDSKMNPLVRGNSKVTPLIRLARDPAARFPQTGF